jgi:hypothetical protein
MGAVYTTPPFFLGAPAGTPADRCPRATVVLGRSSGVAIDLPAGIASCIFLTGNSRPYAHGPARGLPVVLGVRTRSHSVSLLLYTIVTTIVLLVDKYISHLNIIYATLSRAAHPLDTWTTAFSTL